MTRKANKVSREAHLYAISQVVFGGFFFLLGVGAATILQAVVS